MDDWLGIELKSSLLSKCPSPCLKCEASNSCQTPGSACVCPDEFTDIDGACSQCSTTEEPRFVAADGICRSCSVDTSYTVTNEAACAVCGACFACSADDKVAVTGSTEKTECTACGNREVFNCLCVKKCGTNEFHASDGCTSPDEIITTPGAITTCGEGVCCINANTGISTLCS